MTHPILLLYNNKMVPTYKQICFQIRFFILTKDILAMPIWTNNQYSAWVFRRRISLCLIRYSKREKSQERQGKHSFSKKFLHLNWVLIVVFHCSYCHFALPVPLGFTAQRWFVCPRLVYRVLRPYKRQALPLQGQKPNKLVFAQPSKKAQMKRFFHLIIDFLFIKILLKPSCQILYILSETKLEKGVS